MKRDDTKGMMPKNKRTNKYFWHFDCSSYAKGQGKRIGGMIVGGNTGTPVAKYSIQETTIKNLDSHFSHYGVYVASMGDGTRLSKIEYDECCKDINKVLSILNQT